MTSYKRAMKPDHHKKPELTTEQVVARVREMVQNGQLKPGDRLPPERELARRLGISRPSLRGGLRSLASMGVLKSRHGSGTFVADGPPMLDSKQLSLLAELHGFTPGEMFEARRLLEVGLAGLAAERASSEHLAQLAEEVAEMYECLENPQQYLIHDLKFHSAIAMASGNPILATLMQMVSAAIYEQRIVTVDRTRDLNQATLLHRKIYKAIRNRKPDEARASMNEHLDQAQRSIATEDAEAESKAMSKRTVKGKTASRS